MGDRAVVLFKSKNETVPTVAVYLHCEGYRVPELLAGAAPRMRAGDASYAAARFIGYCHEQIEGALSLGVWGLSEEHQQDIADGHAGRLGHGDSGVFLVDVTEGTVVQYPTEYPRGDILAHVSQPPGPKPIAANLELYRG